MKINNIDEFHCKIKRIILSEEEIQNAVKQTAHMIDKILENRINAVLEPFFFSENILSPKKHLPRDTP